MMLNIEPLDKHHIEIFESFKEVGNELHFVLNNKNIRNAFSLISTDGYIVGILGASFIGKGIWEGWFYPSKKVKNHTRALVRSSKLMSDLIVEKDMHRLQIAVLSDNKKWAESLGFQFEGIVKNYHGNKDHFMYIKVRG